MAWTGRTEPTAPTWNKRLGYSYLTDISGNFITDINWNFIIVLAYWWDVDDSNFVWRTKPTNTWTKITRP